MLKHQILITVFIVLGILNLNAQDTLPYYQSKDFRCIDLNLGVRTPLNFYQIPITIVYQQNIRRNFSWISFSQLYAKSNHDESLNEDYKSTNWVEAVGIGGTIGNKGFNTGLFLVGGGRFFHSKVNEKNSTIFQEPTLVTNKLNPELGLLYNLKVGKKKLYFTSQVYISMLPIKNFYSNLHTVSIGVGYRFKDKG
jgi:hypothetical protein